MSNTQSPRIAETTVYIRNSSESSQQRYETAYRYEKREFGGWTIVLTDHSAHRTVNVDSVLGRTAEFDGTIGWLVKNDEGWTAYHNQSGEVYGKFFGSEWSTRDEAVENLLFELLNRHVISPASHNRHLIASDAIDYNELVLTASKPVDQFTWERDYDLYLARREASKSNQTGESK